MNSTFKKLVIIILIVSLFIYLWYAIFPLIIGWSFPTGGWDWLEFTGIVVGLAITAWGIIKTIESNHIQMIEQQRLSVVPCINAVLVSPIFKDTALVLPINEESKNIVFFGFAYKDGRFINNGFWFISKGYKNPPNNFMPSFFINISNLGLSTAFSVEISLFELKEIDGIDCLDDIAKKTIPSFYDRIKLERYDVYENGEKLQEWIISPEFNLGNANDEINLVLDTTKLITPLHSIFVFRYKDIYKNKYHQYLYIYTEPLNCRIFPISQIYQS